jgi:hypothetical protein
MFFAKHYMSCSLDLCWLVASTIDTSLHGCDGLILFALDIDLYFRFDTHERIGFVDPNLAFVIGILSKLGDGSIATGIAEQADLDDVPLGFDTLAVPQHRADVGCSQAGENSDGDESYDQDRA